MQILSAYSAPLVHKAAAGQAYIGSVWLIANVHAEYRESAAHAFARKASGFPG